MRARPAFRIVVLAFALLGAMAIGAANGAGMDGGVDAMPDANTGTDAGVGTGTGSDQGLIVTPTPLDFGPSQVGTSASNNLSLQNTNSSLSVHVAAPLGKPNTPDCNAFTVTPSPALPDTIPATTTRTWGVKFNPPQPTNYDCQWTLADDDGNPDVIHLTGRGIAGHITITPNPLDFGSQPVGTGISVPFTMSNDGSGSISITSITQTSGNPPFSITAKPILPLLLDPGDQAPVTIKFKPTTTGGFTGAVQIADDGPSSTGTTVMLLGSGGTGSGAVITMTPNPLDFGDIAVGSQNGGNVTIGNSGTATLTVTAMTVTGADASQFSFADASLGCTSGQSCTSGFSVGPSGVPRQVALQCAPTSSGLHFATLGVSSNASSGTSSITLKCNGYGPTISVSPQSISYGTIKVNTTAHQNLHIANVGSSDLHVSKINIDGTNPGDFAPQACASGCTINAGSFVNVDVTFVPPVRGVRSANLHVQSDDPSRPDVVVGLDGTGGLPVMVITQPAGKSINFGGIPINTTSSTAPITVQNQGELTLNISSAAASPSDFGSTGPTTPIGLAPSASATWNVTCHPTLPIGYSGAFTVMGDDPVTPSAAVTLACTGIDSKIVASPNPLSFGEVRTDQTAMTTVTFTNTGALPITINSAPISGPPFTEIVTGLPRTLNQNDQQTVTVKFTPTADMHYDGTLSLLDNTGATAASVALSGDGRVPDYMVAPTAIDFGSLCVAQADNQDVVITNDGTAHISLVSTAISGGGGAFAISNGDVATPIDLAPTAMHTVTIVGTAAQGQSMGDLVVTTDVGAKATTNVSLQITGTQSGVVANPSSVDFGAHDLGVATAPSAVTIINCSSSPLTISAVAVTGADATAFQVSGTQPVTIPVGGNQAWNVVFTAAHAGDHAAVLDLTNDGPFNPLAVPLSGSGNGTQSGGDGGVDAGTAPKSTSYYACGCRAGATPGGAAPLVLAFALVFGRRRRRRRR